MTTTNARRARLAASATTVLLAAWLAGCSSNDDEPAAAAPPSADETALKNACTQVGTTPTDTGFTVGSSGAPEISTGYASKSVVYARTIMAVTANPIASRAACDVLKQGGTAVDAAIAAQMVLNLVEPQSSGIGGGAFMLVYDAARQQLRSYDGRETAPAAATENYLRWVSDTDQTPPQPNAGSVQSPFAQASGRSIGTPGALRMLELAHRNHGRLAWSTLMQPGIKTATDGFPISPRMFQSINAVFTNTNPVTRALLTRDADIANYFLLADRSAVKPIGTVLRNPALADTFARIAAGGADAFYSGEIAQSIVAEIAETYAGTTTSAGAALVTTPGVTTLADLARYQARERAPVCIKYRSLHEVCGMGPPSSGGLAVAQTLGILESFTAAQFPAPDAIDKDGGKPRVESVHLFAEANRLAYADRNRYVADTDFVSLPGLSTAAMIDKAYLASRAALINASTSMGTAQPGLGAIPVGNSTQATENGTTHLTIRDAYGNVVSMTTTIESGFGSYHMVRGFLLNNQLTDFDAAPTDTNGVPIANRLQPGKRPRSSMAPTVVFKLNPDGSRGDFHMAVGSPGGATIIQYVAKTLVGVLDWKLDAQQAVSMVDFGAANSATTNVGGEHPNVLAGNNGASDPLVIGLRARGHTVNLAAQSSGLSSIVAATVGGKPGFAGGADPRREGIVAGDVVTP